MAKTFPLLIASLVIGLTGYQHGVWTSRWSPSHELERAVARLDQVPMEIGGWQGKVEHLESDMVKNAQLAGYILRSYENPADGHNVKILLMCGRPGPLAVHTPDICYTGAGYQMVAPETTYPPNVDNPPFSMGIFSQSQLPVPNNLCILWSWSADGAWKSPTNPRWEFARYPALYKLYVICRMPTAGGLMNEDPRTEFVEKLLPILQTTLFPSTS